MVIKNNKDFKSSLYLIWDGGKKRWKGFHLKSYRVFLSTIGDYTDRTSRVLYRLLQGALYFALLIFSINLLSIGKSSFGEFGDFFGGILNPILTFFMFMGLLLTIIVQQKELRLNREESKRASDSLFKSQEYMSQQNKYIEIDSLKDDIFRFISLANERISFLLEEEYMFEDGSVQNKKYILYKAMGFYENKDYALQEMYAERIEREIEDLSGFISIYVDMIIKLEDLGVDKYLTRRLISVYKAETEYLYENGLIDAKVACRVSPKMFSEEIGEGNV